MPDPRVLIIRTIVGKIKGHQLRSGAAEELQGHTVVATARVKVAVRHFNQLTGQRSLVKTLVGTIKAAVTSDERIFVAIRKPDGEVTL
jgi:hypothetical protein